MESTGKLTWRFLGTVVAQKNDMEVVFLGTATVPRNTTSMSFAWISLLVLHANVTGTGWGDVSGTGWGGASE